MIKTIDHQVSQILDELHLDAKQDMHHIQKRALASFKRPSQPRDFEDAYLPISKEQGEHLRSLIIDNNCKKVVEFGTSFGISTIYLADAVKRSGGKVITTELIESKGLRALENIRKAGLNSYVELRVGDAMRTLKDFNDSIDLLFLDGWKDLYLPLFKMLESSFRLGTLIYADNMDMINTQDYADYIYQNRSKYSSTSVDFDKALLTRML